MRRAVRSSNIATVAYDARSRRLYVEFQNGGVYAYDGVASGVYRGLLSAESVGGFFIATIRGRYPSSKVEAMPEPREPYAVMAGDRQLADCPPCGFWF